LPASVQHVAAGQQTLSKEVSGTDEPKQAVYEVSKPFEKIEPAEPVKPQVGQPPRPPQHTHVPVYKQQAPQSSLDERAVTYDGAMLPGTVGKPGSADTALFTPVVCDSKGPAVGGARVHPEAHEVLKDDGAETEKRVQLTPTGSQSCATISHFDVVQSKPEPKKDPEVLQVLDALPQVRCVRRFRSCVVWSLALEEPVRSGCLNCIISSRVFEISCNLVILLNAAYAAWNADYEMANIGADPLPVVHTAETLFLLWYLMELTLKLLVHRFYFFAGDDARWNMFDAFLVAFSMYDMFMDLLNIMTGVNILFIRILRLLKLTKVLRLLRAIRCVRELRLMLQAMIGTLSSLFWAIIFLLMVLFIFGLILMQGVTGYLLEYGEQISEEEHESVTKNYGSMSAVMLTIFKASSGGNDWEEYYEICERAGGLYGAVFLFYVAFFTFAIMNVLTGVIVENVVTMAEKCQNAVVLEYQMERHKAVENLVAIFKYLDHNGSGRITADEFQRAVLADEAGALMQQMELEVRDAERFFDLLLDISDDDGVDIAVFVDGCLRMKGPATSIETQSMMHELRLYNANIKELLHQLSQHNLTPKDEIRQETSALLQRHATGMGTTGRTTSLSKVK
jgi:cytochrome b